MSLNQRYFLKSTGAKVGVIALLPHNLFSSLTGSIGNFKFMSVFGVQWPTHSTEIKIFTKINSMHIFDAQLFYFGCEPRKMELQFYNLDNGNYHFNLNEKQQSNFELKENNGEIKFIHSTEKLVNFKL